MKQIVIWDDFYSNPIEMRNVALDTQYQDKKETNYPGINSNLSFFPDEMKHFFSFLAGEPLKPSVNSACGNFRIQNKNDVGKQYIHIDLPSEKTRWAAVCHLSLPEYYTKEDGSFIDAGCKFWKHKETGLEQLPFDVKYLSTIGLNGYDDLFNFMNTEGTDESKWINTMSVPIKFNRLIMFRSNLWHSQGELFGDTKENGRLIQTFFFEPDLEVIEQLNKGN